MWPDPQVLRTQKLMAEFRKRWPDSREENQRRSERRAVRRKRAEAEMEAALREIYLMRDVASEVARRVLWEFEQSYSQQNYEMVVQAITNAQVRADALDALPPIEVPADFVERVEDDAQQAWLEYREEAES
jgi:hypothetical protein